MRGILLIIFICYSSFSWSQCGGNVCAICDVTVSITDTDATVTNGSTTITNTIAAGGEATATALVIQAGGCGIISLDLEKILIGNGDDKEISGDVTLMK